MAVTIAAVVAFVIGAGNLIAFGAGLTVSGERPSVVFVVAQSGLLLAAAWGMWRARYWAVLGMQALLALLVILFGVLLISASNALAVVVSLAVIAGAGTLFWFLVKALARIQMPSRR